MMKLYFAPGSSSMAPHIALLETGAPYQPVPISFASKQQRSDDFLKINPEGKVPTLVADGTVMTEVAAILYYLARRHPEARLWPEGDLNAEAQVISWMSFIASTLHPARTKGVEHAKGVYALTEKRLGTRAWAIGQYSIADIHLFRLYWRIRDALEPYRASLPAIEAHYARMMTRPAVVRTLEIEKAAGYELP
ncbi:MAG: glutathione S-transferase family protein [Hyphomicrobiaceae bacterium]